MNIMIHTVSKLSSIVQYSKCKATVISKALAESILFSENKQKNIIFTFLSQQTPEHDGTYTVQHFL